MDVYTIMDAWEELQEKSTAVAGSDAWEHLTSFFGGGTGPAIIVIGDIDMLVEEELSTIQITETAEEILFEETVNEIIIEEVEE